MGIMPYIESVLSDTYNYFVHSPKKILEFESFADKMDSRGLKLLRVVPTRWISLLDLLLQVLSEYQGVIGKMMQDRDSHEKAKVCINSSFTSSLELL